MTRELDKINGSLEEFTGLLKAENPPASYRPTDLAQLKLWKQVIDQHLSTAELYTAALNTRAINALPRILSLDAVWYRISRSSGIRGMIFTDENIPTRFNPGRIDAGGFMSLALAQDLPTATFELTSNIDLAVTSAMLRSMFLTQYRVKLQDVVDLTDPDAVKSVLGIDFGTLMGMSFPGKLSVTQKICVTLAQRGAQGAIFPSRTTVGRKNIVVFLRGANGVTVLHSGRVSDQPI